MAAIRGMKSIYVYEDLNHNFLSPPFKTRQDVLAWARNNKGKADSGFLMKREVTRKRYKQLFPES